jgi:hypothetical protein
MMMKTNFSGLKTHVKDVIFGVRLIILTAVRIVIFKIKRAKS